MKGTRGIGIVVASVLCFVAVPDAKADYYCRLLSPNSPDNWYTFMGEGRSVYEAWAINAARNDCLRRNSETGCSYGIPSCRYEEPERKSETSQREAISCIAYEHGWLNGRSLALRAGEAVDLRNYALNDEISSTWTAANCRLAVYRDFGFRGYLMHLGPGENKTLGINDMISSMRCECR